MLNADIPSLDAFKALAAKRGELCVSIYTPTSPLPDQADANRILFKDLARQALAQIREAGVDKSRIAALEERFEIMAGHRTGTLDDNKYRLRRARGPDATELFWARQANGLGVLATPQAFEGFRLPNRPRPLAEVADRFHLTPLIRAMTSPHDILVLALSEKHIRLIHAFVNMPPVRVPLPKAPKSQIDVNEERKLLVEKYARATAKALREALAGWTTPMILAAAEPLASRFRALESYPHLIDETLAGAPDHLTDGELADMALPILDRLYGRELKAAIELYDTLKPRHATTDVSYAAHAATAGGLHELVVDFDAVIPGEVSDIDGSVTYAASDDAQAYSVVDEVARRALATDAKVLAARSDELPGGAPLVAILRYDYGVIEEFPAPAAS